MGSLRRTAATVVSTTVLAGCALISGAADLTVGPAEDAGGGAETSRGGDGDGAIMPDGTTPGADGSSGPTDGSTTDAKKPGDGGDAGTRLREVTFEDGALLGIHGGDSLVGNNAFLTTGLSALHGSDSMKVDKAISGIEVDFAAVTELYATALVRFENIGFGQTTVLAFVPEVGGSPVGVGIQDGGSNSPLLLTVAGLVVGSGGIVDQNVPIRIGVHLRHDAVSDLIEVFLAPSGAAFGLPVVSTTASRLSRVIGARMGVFDNNGTNTRATFDDLLLDTAAMPAP